MATLRHNRWRNATMDEQITALQNELTQAIGDLNKAENRISQCENGGVLYNCWTHTGKTLNTWRTMANNLRVKIGELNKKIATLQEQRAAELARITAQQQAALQVSEAENSNTNVLTKYAFIGAAIIGGIVIILKK